MALSLAHVNNWTKANPAITAPTWEAPGRLVPPQRPLALAAAASSAQPAATVAPFHCAEIASPRSTNPITTMCSAAASQPLPR